MTSQEQLVDQSICKSPLTKPPGGFTNELLNPLSPRNFRSVERRDLKRFNCKVTMTTVLVNMVELSHCSLFVVGHREFGIRVTG